MKHKTSETTTVTETDEATLTDDQLRAALEAVFFAADEPVTRELLAELFPAVKEGVLERELRQLELDYSGPTRGIHLAEVAGGFQFRTNPDYNRHILNLFESKPVNLSRAALETLAIVAYRQPVTRAVVEEIRGVDCGGMLRKLTELELLQVVGKMDDIGRPNLYGSTPRFLEFFGLRSLADLPTLDEFEVDAAEMFDEVFKEKDLGEAGEEEKDRP